MNSSGVNQSGHLEVFLLGLQNYDIVWEFQREKQKALIQNTGLDSLIICEHPPVITLGRQAHRDSILRPLEALKEQGIEVFEIERGGEVTVHEPGQLVCYPIIDLAQKKRDVGWYMRSLEEVILRTLAAFNLEAKQITGKTGVWISVGDAEKKIASIGVRISRWKTLHGLAINISNSLETFDYIDPCGMKDVQMTSLENELKNKKLAALTTNDKDHPVVQSLIDNFLTVFSYSKEGVVYGSIEYLKNLA